MRGTSTAGRLRRVAAGLSRAVSLPPALAHELTHLLLSLPWADSAALQFEADGGAHLHVDWAEGAPAWGIWLAFRGPLLLGSVAGVAGLWQLASGGLPDDPSGTLLAAAVAGWWIIYVVPSAADRRGQSRSDEQSDSETDRSDQT